VDGIEEDGVGRGAERARDVSSEGSIFEVRGGGIVGLMEKADISGGVLGVCGRLDRVDDKSGGCGGRGGGIWSRHTFSSWACLEPTRTGVGSPGANIESEVGIRRQNQNLEGEGR
jgi:hypothetical protein